MLNNAGSDVDQVTVPSVPALPSRRLVALGLAAAALISLVVPLDPAMAAPAPPVANAAASNPEQLEVLAEQYNFARLKVDRANALVDATEQRIQASQSRLALVRARARDRAAALYRGTGSGNGLPIGPSSDVADVARRGTYLNAAEQPDRDLLRALTAEIARLDGERTSQREQRLMLESNLNAAVRARQRLQTMAAAPRSAGPATGDGAGPISTTAPPTGARGSTPGGSGVPSPTPTTTRPPTTGTTPPPPPPPPPPPGSEPPVSPGAGTAVAFARAQLGKPYVFATSGPNTFDCSGLTMAAWAAAGVRMAHYSGSQASSFPKVTWDQLKPGDLVLFYSDLHHVGLYIGGGQMIHAPQTGDVVKIAPAWRDTFMFAVRPH